MLIFAPREGKRQNAGFGGREICAGIDKMYNNNNESDNSHARLQARVHLRWEGERYSKVNIKFELRDKAAKRKCPKMK